jgi:hypothetical protein
MTSSIRNLGLLCLLTVALFSPGGCGGSTVSDAQTGGGGTSGSGGGAGGTDASSGGTGASFGGTGASGGGSGTGGFAAGGGTGGSSGAPGGGGTDADAPWCTCPADAPSDGAPCACKGSCAYPDCPKAEYTSAWCGGGVWHVNLTWDWHCPDAG